MARSQLELITLLCKSGRELSNAVNAAAKALGGATKKSLQKIRIFEKKVIIFKK